jgi:hypothetical protein
MTSECVERREKVIWDGHNMSYTYDKLSACPVHVYALLLVANAIN